MTKLLLELVILVVLVTSCANGQVTYVTAEAKAQVLLECPVKVPANYQDDRLWILPNGVEVRPYAAGDEKTVRVKMEANHSLIIASATVQDSGLYICHIHVANEAGQLMYGKVQLTVTDDSVIVQPWASAKDYKSNVIRGIIAAVSTALGFSICCLVHKFRWKSPEQRAKKKSSQPAGLLPSSASKAAILPQDTSALDEAYDNPALSASYEDVSRL